MCLSDAASKEAICQWLTGFSDLGVCDNQLSGIRKSSLGGSFGRVQERL